jgi:FkbM family methyltransferase
MSLARVWRFLGTHPLTRTRRWRAMARVLRYQLAWRLSGRALRVPFVDDSVLCVRRGMTGATGNVYCGLHEFEHMAFCMHLLRAGDMFLDVGANVGSYTVLAAAADAQVLALEPVPATHAALCANIAANALNARVEAPRLGVAAAPGRLRFSSAHDTVNRVLRADEQVADAIDVEVSTVDALLAGRVPLALKLDVEGYERAVLDGAARTLVDPGLIAMVVEMNDTHTNADGTTRSEVDERLRAVGFTRHRYEPFTRALSIDTGPPPVGGNAIYVRDTARVAERVRTARTYRIHGAGRAL